ncbi:hypothetical protein ACFPM3_12255 [Streptomyces coeruleoprunus]|uniref:Uncharacterized protein n=1 Tax=Streptomyces coeruleoprunus TaxID=285563 RepID=A0ABV9XEN8_9ACTN
MPGFPAPPESYAGAGVVGFAARAAGVAPSLGAPPPEAAPAVGAVRVTGWAVATVGAMRRPSP